jgi:hypothetical protein
MTKKYKHETRRLANKKQISTFPLQMEDLHFSAISMMVMPFQGLTVVRASRAGWPMAPSSAEVKKRAWSTGERSNSRAHHWTTPERNQEEAMLR